MRRHTLRHFEMSHCLILAASLTVAYTGCDAAVRTATRETKPLAYVGQIQLRTPTNEDGRVAVQLTYVGGEWGQNSAIVPVDVKSAVQDTEIEITVVTSVATDGNAKKGDRFVLPENSKGSCTVYYRDPDGTRDKIGELSVPEWQVTARLVARPFPESRQVHR
jgi:hypothetical protein